MPQGRAHEVVDANLPSVVVIGSASKAGRAIARQWHPCGITGIHRGNGAGVLVSDYRTIPAGAIRPGSVVVNCVGTPRGSARELREINCEVPVAWARTAAQEGASAFIQLSSV